MRKVKYIVCLMMIALVCGMINPLPSSAEFLTTPMIASGTNYCLALKPDGTVWAWGQNNWGQLGNGTTTDSTTPVQVSGLTEITSISADGNGYHSLALKSDGTVWAWGYNSKGQLGNGTITNSTTPVQVSGLTEVISVDAGESHSIALKSDGTVWTWGFNYSGQLGNGTTTTSTTPIQVSSLSGITAISAGDFHSLALKSDGTVWAWGLNTYGELGNGTTKDSKVPVQVNYLTGVTSIFGGYHNSLALQSDGTVRAWGAGGYGQLGVGSYSSTYLNPATITSLTGITSISGGLTHSLFLKSDGTVWASGQNNYYELGNGTTTSSCIPVQVLGKDGIGYLTEITCISGQSYLSYALKSDGTIWYWGSITYRTPTQLLDTSGNPFVLNQAEIIPVTGISLEQTNLNLSQGSQATIIATVTPSNANNKNVIWSTSDSSVATVNNLGFVSAIANGTAVITAKTEDGSFEATCNVTVSTPVDSISLNKNNLVLNIGTNETLTATVLPEAASNKNVTWTSSDPAVAMVSNGLVTAVAGGNAIITATTVDGSKQSTCNVTVLVPAQSVSLNKSNTELNIGESETLIATVLPATATNKNVSWTSSNPAVATVDNSGKVGGIATGDAVITVKTEDGNFEAACNITVVNPIISVSSVSLNKNNLELAPGANETLIATVLPENANNKNLTWSTSDSSVASVDANGLVSAVSGGSAIIKVKTEDGGYEATCNVLVKIPVESISLDKDLLNLLPGESDNLVASVLPDNASDKSVTWSTSDPTVALVDSTGKVSGVSEGDAIITATTVDGNKIATCNIEVSNTTENPDLNFPIAWRNKELNYLEITPESCNVTAGTTQQVTVKAHFADETIANVTNYATYTSNHSEIADADSQGLITAANSGTAVITASLKDKSVACTVTVPAISVTGISLNVTNLSLLVGQNNTLVATITPSNASNKGVTWESSTPIVATVNNGMVSAIAVGQTIITARTEDGNFIANCNVEVTNPIIPVSSVSLNKNSMDLQVGNEDTLVATVFPNNATNKNISFVSSNPTVATVDTDGKVVAVAAGSAIITVTTEDGNFSATCNVVVFEPTPILQSLSVTPTSISLIAGDNQQITVKANYSNGNIEDVTTSAVYASNKPGVAAMDTTTINQVNGLAPGSAMITVSYNGQSATIPVTVANPKVKALIINPSAINLAAGMSKTVTVTARMTDGSNVDVTNQATLAAADPTVVNINNNTVIGVKAGSTVLNAACQGVTANISVTVQAPVVQSLTITPNIINIATEKTSEVLVTKAIKSDGSEEIVPNSKVQYSVSTSGVASITGDYRVLGKTAGNSLLTASYSGFTGQANVTVTAPVATGLNVTPSSISCNVGDTVALIVTATMSDGTTKDVTSLATYTSSSQVVDVNSKGVILALRTGSGEITVAYAGNSINVPVTVNYQPQPINVAVGNSKILKLSDICNDINVKVTITSSDTSIATVANNRVTGRKIGTCSINVTYYNSQTGTSGSYAIPIQVTSIPVNRPGSI